LKQPCRFHDASKPSSLDDSLDDIFVEPPGLPLHIYCLCSDKVCAAEPPIYRNGTSLDLLPPFFRTMLSLDLPHKDEPDFRAYQKSMFESRSVLMRPHNSFLDHKVTVNALKTVCLNVGAKVPSKLTSKYEIVNYTLRVYEAEVKLRTSSTFLEGSLKDWNCNSLAQILKVYWRKNCPSLRRLYGNSKIKN
jgi:hypothetical protein